MTEVQEFGQQLGGFMTGVFGGTNRESSEHFQSDPRAEAELRGFLADLQTAFENHDIDHIVNSLDDDFTTYELTAEDGIPQIIREKARMREYLATLFPADGETQFKTIAATQVIASRNIGLINEEGDVVIGRDDQTKEHQPLLSSALAIRTSNGWRWRHWHMSEAGPRFLVNLAGEPIDDDGNPIPGARVVIENGTGRVVIDGDSDQPTASRPTVNPVGSAGVIRD